jgi:hypothetical protein
MSLVHLFFSLAFVCFVAAVATVVGGLQPPSDHVTGASSFDGSSHTTDAGEWVSVWTTEATATFGSPPTADGRDLLPHPFNVPGERVQGPVDNCWVWAATAVTEIALDVQTGIHDRLSIQDCDATYRGGAGADWAGARGWVADYVDHLPVNPALVPWSNANASYRDGTR